MFAWRRLFGRPLNAYAASSRAWPMPVAFATCYAKGAASDAVTQRVVERKAEVDWRRNVAFAAFSGAYLGCGQHIVYNVVFTRLFGAGLDARTSFMKTMADALGHVPLLYLPLYYAFEDAVLKDGPLEGLKRYSNEWWDCMKPYWCLFTPFHFLNFIFTPPELRIGLIACMSFVWLIVLSFVSHRAYEAEKDKCTDGVVSVATPAMASLMTV
eukprot:TRINITY_DN59539_c0_g1_i1.p1 TRINITY_DN59539_c0_g1~~TRINITY_DN59539_c0_g1_i1.p1  ORF type:complete len:224 (-),score=27.60 TRINITY_DN59539_c0_g1_i1:94-729(-)